jgi:hypothetical protein
MQSKEKLVTLCGLSKEETELDFSGQKLEAGDAVLIANDISDMGALTKIDISDNMLGPEGGKALAEALKGNQIITKLNIATNSFGMKFSTGGVDASGVIAIANAIPDMGALSHFDISNNDLYAAGTKSIAEGLKGNQVVTELNISGNGMGKISKYGSLDLSGVAALADVVPGMGALSKFTFSGDDKDGKPVTMETSMVEADFGAKGLGASAAIMVAAFLPKCT